MKRDEYDFIMESYDDIQGINKKYTDIKNPLNKVFYRGQADSSWMVEATIERNNELCEAKVVQQEINSNGNELQKGSLFQYIAHMQHYGCPTRFLDLTTNLDIALFFACVDPRYADKNGKIFMFKYEPRKPTNIDTLIISELCLIQKEICVEKISEHLIRKYIEFDEYTTCIKKLNMRIMSFIDHGFVVLPEEDDYKDMEIYNPRIRRQEGAFFVCGNRTKENITSRDRWESNSGNVIIQPKINPVPSTLWHPDWSYSIIVPKSLKQEILLRVKESGITKVFYCPPKKKS